MSDESQSITDAAWKWTPQRDKAALAVAESATIIDAAKLAGVTRETIHRWMNHPEFKARVDEHLEEVVGAARSILRRNAVAAAQQMVNILAHGHPQHAVKLAAAKDVLDRVGLKAPEKLEHGGGMTVRWIEDGDGGD